MSIQLVGKITWDGWQGPTRVVYNFFNLRSKNLSTCWECYDSAQSHRGNPKKVVTSLYILLNLSPAQFGFNFGL